MAIDPRGRWFWLVYMAEGLFGIYFSVVGAFAILKECVRPVPTGTKIAGAVGASFLFLIGIGLAEAADRLRWRRKNYPISDSVIST